MPDPTETRTRDAIARTVRMARRIAARDDVRARDRIERFQASIHYDKRHLCIAKDAWRHVKEAGIKRRQVFAHPDLLKAIPDASLHYQGMALLSLKRVQEIAGSVDSWENSPDTARVSDEKALRVCRLYNTVISSIILDSADWTLDNGYRNIVATLGITADGSIRNVIGQEAETAVKERLLDWVCAHRLFAEADTGARAGIGGGPWRLVGGVRMIYSSEPDIAFKKDGGLAVIVEVKGGKDPAGALERLGALKKTFDETPAGCKNFLVAGIVTSTMRARLREMRMERDFDIGELLQDGAAWVDFMNEIFHHALRIADETARWSG